LTKLMFWQIIKSSQLRASISANVISPRRDFKNL
jgi:hypothetical protein